MTTSTSEPTAPPEPASGPAASGTGSVLSTVQSLLTLALIVGILAQIYAAGLMIYGRPQIHRMLGYGVILTAYLAAAISLAAYGWRRVSRLACGAALLLTLQPVFVFLLASVSPYLGALHTLNGVVALLVAVAARAESRASSRSSPIA